MIEPRETVWTPQSHNVTDWRLNMGRHALRSREGLRNDLALAGPPGLLSIFETLIGEDDHLTRDDLLSEVKALIRPELPKEQRSPQKGQLEERPMPQLKRSAMKPNS